MLVSIMAKCWGLVAPPASAAWLWRLGRGVCSGAFMPPSSKREEGGANHGGTLWRALGGLDFQKTLDDLHFWCKIGVVFVGFCWYVLSCGWGASWKYCTYLQGGDILESVFQRKYLLAIWGYQCWVLRCWYLTFSEVQNMHVIHVRLCQTVALFKE